MPMVISTNRNSFSVSMYLTGNVTRKTRLCAHCMFLISVNKNEAKVGTKDLNVKLNWLLKVFLMYTHTLFINNLREVVRVASQR